MAHENPEHRYMSPKCLKSVGIAKKHCSDAMTTPHGHHSYPSNVSKCKLSIDFAGKTCYTDGKARGFEAGSLMERKKKDLYGDDFDLPRDL